MSIASSLNFRPHHSSATGSGPRSFKTNEPFVPSKSLLLFLAFFLRSDHHKIHDDQTENQRHKKRPDADAWELLRRRALSLGKKCQEHAKNWRAHLKRKSERCNRSFASVVLRSKSTRETSALQNAVLSRQLTRMHETTKTKKLWGALERSILTGRGIDIGCGQDPVRPNVRRFDVEDGDANEITKYVHEQFDFVYASHCLEHMRDPRKALLEWWQLVRAGGHLL